MVITEKDVTDVEYKVYSLDGTWEMAYETEKYTGKRSPWKNDELNLAEFSGMVENAVPGYWEDMTESFSRAPFFSHLRINPQYGIQRYPIFGDPPDMALPNIMGNFFYRRTFFHDGTDSPTVMHFEGVQNSGPDIIERTMQRATFIQQPTLDNYFQVDAEARRMASELL